MDYFRGRKKILMMEVRMVSGIRYDVTASGYYEDEFEDFIDYLKREDNRFIAGSKIIINIDSIESVEKTYSNCYPDDTEVDRRKVYGSFFSIRQNYRSLDLKGHVPNLMENQEETIERIAFKLKESIEGLIHKGEQVIPKDDAR